MTATARPIPAAEVLAGAAHELLDWAAEHPGPDAPPELARLADAVDAMPGREVLAARERVVDEAVDGFRSGDAALLHAAVVALLAAERAESTSYKVEREDRLRAPKVAP
jgi:hypothetical protein